MKKHYLSLVLLAFVSIVKAQIITIHDNNFKAKLLAANTTNSIARNNFGNSIQIDINNDGEIQESEALLVYELRLMSSNISDLSGVEYFTNLINLNCEINQITSLDVSALTNLQNFGCSNNQLTTLDVSSLNVLYFFTCRYNQLSTLNLGTISSLGAMDCGNNQLNSLDVSHNINLGSLQCSNNLLTTLDLTGLTEIAYLFCSGNQLGVLDVSEQSILQLLNCNNNSLTYLNIKNSSIENPLSFSGNPNLTMICADSPQVIDVQNLTTSYGYNNCVVNSTCQLNSNQIENELSFSIYPNPATTILNLENNSQIGVKSIEIYNILGQMVIAIPNAENVTSIDVTTLKSGTYFIKVNTDMGTAHTKFIKE